MQLADLVQGHGEQAEGEGVAQDGLIGEGQLAHVGQGLDVGGRHPHLVHLGTVVGHALVGVGHGILELRQLHGLDLLARGALDIGLVDGQRVEAPLGGGAQGAPLLGHVDGGSAHLTASFSLRSATKRAISSWLIISTGSPERSSKARFVSVVDSTM